MPAKKETKGKSPNPSKGKEKEEKKKVTKGKGKENKKDNKAKGKDNKAKGKKDNKAGAKGKSKVVKKAWKATHAHLFHNSTREYGIGKSLPPKRNLYRFVKWPRYIRMQRQRAILKKRLKVPPAINHFAKTLEKNQASNLFSLLARYRPETADAKKKRLSAQAKKIAAGDSKEDESKKPRVLKYGLNHVTKLIETRKAKLVVLAHDVDPIELVVWLPALCRRMDVPYCIVKSKARLGYLVHHKTASCVAITDVKKEHAEQLNQLISNFRPLYNDSVADRKKWGGGILGSKAQAVVRARERAKAIEAKKTA